MARTRMKGERFLARELVTPAEAARQLRVSRQTITRAMNRDRLEYINIAGNRLIWLGALAEYSKIKDRKPGRPPKRTAKRAAEPGELRLVKP